MSNPAVITLDDTSAKKGKFKRFVIEDNIGESIHLHVDNIRVDFTINEFQVFSKMLRDSLEELDILDGYNINKFDESFLKSCSVFLPNLIEIKKERIKLKELKAISYHKYKDLTLRKIMSLNDTPHYKFLKGNIEIFQDYPQSNYISVSNKERLENLKESIKTKGYPYNEQYIILFNGQNFVRDGLHRATILSYLFGLDYEIEILRFHFKGNKHYLRHNYSNLKIFLKWFLIKVKRRLKRYLTK